MITLLIMIFFSFFSIQGRQSVPFSSEKFKFDFSFIRMKISKSIDYRQLLFAFSIHSYLLQLTPDKLIIVEIIISFFFNYIIHWKRNCNFKKLMMSAKNQMTNCARKLEEKEKKIDHRHQHWTMWILPLYLNQ